MGFYDSERIPNEFVLGMATIPIQKWETPYAPEKALHDGTIFPGLNLPFFAADEVIGGALK